MRKTHILFALGLLLLSALLLMPGTISRTLAKASPPAEVEDGLRERVQTDGKGTYWVQLAEQADLSAAYGIQDWNARGQYVYDALLKTAHESQADLLSYLDAEIKNGNVTSYRSYFINNSVLVTSNVQVLDTLAARAGVSALRATRTYPVPEMTPGEQLEALQAIEWGVNKVRSPEIWANFGATGEGVIVANIDTGVAYTHAALVNQYRGNLGGGNFNHSFNWYDPTNLCPNLGNTPCDQNNHGTHTMGTMVGDDGGANQIGNAPDAKWIAARGCETSFCSDFALMSSWEWMVAPCALGDDPGDPSCDPDQRPHVLNYSIGGPGGDPSDQPEVNAARAAGIVLAISAGNSGPGANTVGSPGDYCNVIGTGATDINDVIASFSSRGPGNFDCGNPVKQKPDVSAPGVNVRSSIANGSYGFFNGTSMAAPHVAGCSALFRSIDINVTHDQIFTALTSTAVDLGAPGFDFSYGFGRIDCYAAAQFLFSSVTPTPTPTGPTPTPTTVTPTPTSNVRPTKTPTPPAGSTMHVGDLDGASVSVSNGWNATVTITVHDASHNPVSGAVVTGSWSAGATGSGTCTTNASGQCSITRTGIRNTSNSVNFTVSNVTKSGFSYSAAANHDPDADSNGTTITVNKP